LEIVIWRVPKPVPPTEHGYKYRAVYVVDGVRIVGFDNERGKGDHCHMDGKELPYTFMVNDSTKSDKDPQSAYGNAGSGLLVLLNLVFFSNA